MNLLEAFKLILNEKKRVTTSIWKNNGYYLAYNPIILTVCIYSVNDSDEDLAEAFEININTINYNWEIYNGKLSPIDTPYNFLIQN